MHTQNSKNPVSYIWKGGITRQQNISAPLQYLYYFLLLALQSAKNVSVQVTLNMHRDIWAFFT